MTYAIIGVLAVALIATIYMIYRQSKKIDLQKKMLTEKYQHEMAATVEKYRDQQLTIEEEFHREVMEIKENHDRETAFFRQSVSQLNRYIDDVQSYAKKSSNVSTYQALYQLKQRWIDENKILDEDMIIMPNVFIPFYTEDRIKTCRVDHLILLPTGIYSIEEKHWKGKIIHGLTDKNAKEFSFLLDMVQAKPFIQVYEQTLVFSSASTVEGQDDSLGLLYVKAYADPAKEAWNTAKMVSRFLVSKMGAIINDVTPILYFNHQHQDHSSEGVIDLSKDSSVIRVGHEKELFSLLEEQFDRPMLYSREDLRKIKENLEHIHYIRDSIEM
ncbi:nuclease-related domain-containing protein [Priestia koreensis]|uniref:nuclease-related domain-containing protein n=1 Tax=Priestia koreensis TaxID=284581 RepID=UPI001F56D9A9|nr:nuclease-related domain-containing protein [Priestia koreensis]UNL84393.1 NERD domain-containing protein [Priestia koreensis]